MKSTVILLASLALLTTSCGHSYYVPNAQNVPMFRQAGDNNFLVSTGSSMDEGSTMFDLQGAYAITHNLALTGEYFYHQQFQSGDAVETIDDATDYSKGSMLEVGGGYYQPFGKVGSFSLIGGYGNGKQFHHYNTTTYEGGDYWEGSSILETGVAHLRYSRYFLQPSVGLTTKIVDVAFSTRLSSMSYYDVNAQLEGQGDEYHTLNQIAGSSYWWIEPALTLRLGYAPVKMQMQMLLSQPLTESNPTSPSFCVNIGLTFSIPQAKKK